MRLIAKILSADMPASDIAAYLQRMTTQATEAGDLRHALECTRARELAEARAIKDKEWTYTRKEISEVIQQAAATLTAKKTAPSMEDVQSRIDEQFKLVENLESKVADLENGSAEDVTRQDLTELEIRIENLERTISAAQAENKI